MKTHYIFDIDGTLADASHRIHLIAKHPKDWEKFFSHSEMMQDRPIFAALQLVVAAHNAGHKISFLTGRPERTRSTTINWLSCYGVPWSINIDLLMREDGNHENDNVLKLRILEQIDPNRESVIFEDRSRIVRALRDAGYRVYQVADGDF